MKEKRFIRTMFLALMLTASITALAADKIVVSTGNRVRLRTGPSTNYPMLVWTSTNKPVFINKGEHLPYLGANDTNDFYNVLFNGKSVYISKKFSILVDPNNSIDSQTPVIREPVVVVKGTNVRLRWEPSLDASLYTDGNGKPIYPPKGSQLHYLGQIGNWFKVKYDGHELYISKKHSYLRQ